MPASVTSITPRPQRPRSGPAASTRRPFRDNPRLILAGIAVYGQEVRPPALLDRADFAGDLTEGVLCRIGEEFADGHGEIVAFAFEADPFTVEACDEFRGCDDGIMTISARYRAGMTIFAEYARFAIAEAAADATKPK